jgi:acetyl-CoA carboxylase carboxyltransferase component
MTKEQRELLEKKEMFRKGGGIKAIEKQHSMGKHTARERLELLFDPGTFVETGLFVKHHASAFGMAEKVIPADGVVTGYGYVEGHLVYAYSQDFTALGGTLGEMHANKIAAVQEEALKTRAPIVAINDSGGARIQEGVNALGGYGKIFTNNIRSSGIIPQICAILGPCAGGAVYSPALMDFVFMVDDISQMFITGPRVLKEVTGETVSAQELGGARIHSEISGCAHFRDSTEEECFARIRKLLVLLTEPEQQEGKEEIQGLRRDQNMDYIVPANPRQPYSMRSVIDGIADRGEFFEYQAEFAPNIRTGFIRLNGRCTGVIANEPMVLAGCLDINASDKAARFIRTCDAFEIPLLTLEDVPGYLPGKSQEYGGIIRHGAKLLYAYAEASVPKVTVITRKAYGGAYIGMCSKHLGADYVFAWPSAEIAVMGAEGAANIIFAKEIRQAEDPEEKRKTCIRQYEEVMMNPYLAAESGYVQDIIVPSQTRERVGAAFHALVHKMEQRIQKKHGNIPL